MQDTYDAVYTRWLNDPENFWAEAAEAVHWDKKWDRVLDDSRPPFYKWFPGGLLNTCYNALDRHVESGRANQPALIYDSPVTGIVQTFTYRELLDRWRASPACLPGKKFRKAIGSSFTCPWCRRRSSRCWHARASARFIRWSSAVLPPMSSPIASPTRDRSNCLGDLRHRSRPRHSLQALARQGDRPCGG